MAKAKGSLKQAKLDILPVVDKYGLENAKAALRSIEKAAGASEKKVSKNNDALRKTVQTFNGVADVIQKIAEALLKNANRVDNLTNIAADIGANAAGSGFSGGLVAQFLRSGASGVFGSSQQAYKVLEEFNKSIARGKIAVRRGSTQFDALINAIQTIESIRTRGGPAAQQQATVLAQAAFGEEGARNVLRMDSYQLAKFIENLQNVDQKQVNATSQRIDLAANSANDAAQIAVRSQIDQLLALKENAIGYTRERAENQAERDLNSIQFIDAVGLRIADATVNTILTSSSNLLPALQTAISTGIEKAAESPKLLKGFSFFEGFFSQITVYFDSILQEVKNVKGATENSNTGGV